LGWHLVRCGSWKALPQVTSELLGEVGPAECFYRDELVLRSGRAVVCRFPLFQTPYIFASWETRDPVIWHVVNRIRGVAEIIGGEIPAVISTAEVEAWRSLADADGVISQDALARSRFEIGDPVEFTDGSFSDYPGVFVGFRGQSMGVKIAFLGRETVIYLSPNIVRRVECAPDLVSRTHRCRRNKRGGEDYRRRQTSVEGRFTVACGAPPISKGAGLLNAAQ
jgi:transcription antitermination factor NusG